MTHTSAGEDPTRNPVRTFPAASGRRGAALASVLFWVAFLVFWIHVTWTAEQGPGLWHAFWIALCVFAVGFELLRWRSYRRPMARADREALYLTGLLGTERRIPWEQVQTIHLGRGRRPRALYLIHEPAPGRCSRLIIPYREMESPGGFLELLRALATSARIDPRVAEEGGAEDRFPPGRSRE